MLFLIAFVGAAIIALVLWKAMNSGAVELPQPPRRGPVTGPGRAPRVSGPDDDPEFLRRLGPEGKPR